VTTTTTTPPPVVQPPPLPTHTETHARKAPIVLAIAGVVALGAGVALGALSSSDETSSNATCPNTQCFDSNAVTQNSHARTEAIAADIGFGVGGAALAGAAIWWLVAGTTSTERFTIVPALAGSVGLAAAGRF
jgi:hypothetical protein